MALGPGFVFSDGFIVFSSLNVARVAKYLGLPSLDDDMFSFFTAGRRAENLFHYNAMRSLPGFEELTIR